MSNEPIHRRAPALSALARLLKYEENVLHAERVYNDMVSRIPVEELADFMKESQEMFEQSDRRKVDIIRRKR